jgi:hypothetical protein
VRFAPRPPKMVALFYLIPNITVLFMLFFFFLYIFHHSSTSKNFHFFHFLYPINNFLLLFKYKNSLQYKIFSLFYKNSFYFISHHHFLLISKLTTYYSILYMYLSSKAGYSTSSPTHP